MTNKILLRLSCFAAALALVLLALLARSSMQTRYYRRQVEMTQLRALQDLSGQMNAITIDLQKGTYAGTPAQLTVISAKLWREAAAAKTFLGGLPAEGGEWDEANRFLSQVGDYAMYLSRKSLGGEELTAEERENLERLLDYARTLGHRLADWEYQVSSGQADFEALFQAQPTGDEPVPVSLDLSGEEELESYPTLIYDGPFSDHLLDRRPAMTQGQRQVTPEEALEAASQYAGLPSSGLMRSGDENSHMPCYVFQADSLEVGVTMRGGYVAYLVSGREVGALSLRVAEGLELARAYLEERELGGMKETYYELSGGILTVNYAYVQDDVVCYTDLIKVGVAMDDGGVVFYDARGFLVNHRERELARPLLEPWEAAESVSPSLSVRSVQLALIPTAGQNEVLTYEFACSGREDEDVLVYINVQTGAEEQILILLESPYGTLTM